MKSLGSLYQFAKKKNITIINVPLPQTGSLALEGPNGCYIGLDLRQMPNESCHRVHLAHEIGHCVTGSFYSRYTAVDSRQRHENRADKNAIRRLIPVAELDEAVSCGCTQMWELAEHFGVTEEFMRRAVCLYTHGNLSTELYF